MAHPRTQIKTGVLSPLQEDEGRFYATAVIEKSNAHLKVATVSWLKEPLRMLASESEKPTACRNDAGKQQLYASENIGWRRMH